MRTKKDKVGAILPSGISANEDAYSKFFDEILAITNAFYPKVSKRKCRCDCACNCDCVNR